MQSNDVYMTGKRTNPGNVRFRKQINEAAPEYDAAPSKEAKGRIINKIAKEWFGKILDKDGTKFSDAKTRTKVLQALSDNAPKRKTKNRADQRKPESKERRRAHGQNDRQRPEFVERRKISNQEKKERKREMLDKRAERYHACYAIPAKARREENADAAPIGYTYEEGDCERLAQWAEYKEKFGHTVIFGDHAPPGLERWARNQRQDRREGKMSRKRFLRLDSLGFSWTAFCASR